MEASSESFATKQGERRESERRREAATGAVSRLARMRTGANGTVAAG